MRNLLKKVRVNTKKQSLWRFQQKLTENYKIKENKPNPKKTISLKLVEKKTKIDTKLK